MVTHTEPVGALKIATAAEQVVQLFIGNMEKRLLFRVVLGHVPSMGVVRDVQQILLADGTLTL